MPKLNLVPNRIITTARWLLVLIGAAMAFFEISEHYHDGALINNWFFWLEITTFSILIPLAGIWVMGAIARSEEKRKRATRRLEQQTRLVRSLSTAQEWGEIAGRIVEFPHTVLPVEQVVLWAFNPQTQVFDSVSTWMLHAEAEPESASPCTNCPDCPDGLKQLDNLSNRAVYCLPLCLKGQRTGMLQMLLPPDCALRPDQAEILNAAAPQLSLALDRAQMHRSVDNQQAAVEAERSRVARDLHDTLAQNVALLRLKLEAMLLYDDPEAQISSIRQELSNMQLIANEAYQQVRQTLADLQPDLPQNLAEGLVNRARRVGERSGFQISMQQAGEPHRLRPYAARETFRIFREALNNIEKHAAAQNVTFHLTWQTDGLSVQIRDDGCGYDPRAETDGLHFGLGIMQERAAALNGRLEISTQPGQGTTITLWVPAAHYLPVSTDTNQKDIIQEDTIQEDIIQEGTHAPAGG